MLYYRTTGETRELNPDVLAAWIAAHNPKGDGWLPVPETPSYDPATHYPPQWTGTEWQVTAMTAEDLAARLTAYRNTLECSNAQGRLALLQADLLDTVEAYIATQPRAVQVEYQARGTWKRTWPTIISAATALGMTDAQLDALFEAAMTL